MSTAKSKPLNTELPNHSSPSTGRQAPDNLMVLNAESGTRDVNAHLQEKVQLVADYKTLAHKSENLINEVSAQTSSLAQTFSEHEGDFKKLAQTVDVQNKKVDSRLEQVSHNFSFHDAKIMKLYEKEIELEGQNQTLKDLLQQTETEQKHAVISLEKDLESKITSVSDAADQKHQTLSDEQDGLTRRTSQIESRTEQLNVQLQEIDEKHQEQISEHEERLTTHNTNLHHHEARLKQLNSVDEELTLRAEGLKETTQRLNEHSQVLEQTTISLQEQSHELHNAVSQLNEQNEQLEDKTEQLGSQIVSNAQIERHHFQSMTMALSIVAILTILALMYSFINQQSLWQSSMDNDVMVERRINIQLSEQQTQLSQAEQQRKELIGKVAVLQQQLSAEQIKANELVKASQEKNQKIVQLKDDLKEMDENVQFLNTSVGPLRDYHRFSGNQSLLDTSWLAQQSGDHYAIQLVSVDSKQKLYQFVEKNGYAFHDDLAWFTINSNGKDYYILTYGNFNELIQARAALSQLPSLIVAQSPGIARLSDIQSFIY